MERLAEYVPTSSKPCVPRGASRRETGRGESLHHHVTLYHCFSGPANPYRQLLTVMGQVGNKIKKAHRF